MDWLVHIQATTRKDLAAVAHKGSIAELVVAPTVQEKTIKTPCLDVPLLVDRSK